ncbi:trehalase family glycosidase [Paraburkholderia lycopersici]
MSKSLSWRARAKAAGAANTRLQDGFGWTNGVTLMLLDMYGGGQ